MTNKPNVGRAPSPAAFAIDLVFAVTKRGLFLGLNRLNFKGGGRGRPPHTPQA
jgi:hypothetical protein